MYSLIGIYHILLLFIVLQTTQNCYRCFPQQWGIQWSDVNNRFTRVRAGFTAGKSGVAAETVELVLQFLKCFPVQDSVCSLLPRTKHWNCYGILVIVLSCSGLGLLTSSEDQVLKMIHSYSGLGLLTSYEDQALKLLWGLKCCTFLFRTRSTLPSSLRTKYWRLFFLHWYFPIRDSVYSLSIRGPSTKSPTPSYNMSNEHHSVVVPEHSSQFLLPGLIQPVCQAQNATCWGSC